MIDRANVLNFFSMIKKKLFEKSNQQLESFSFYFNTKFLIFNILKHFF